MVGEYFMFFQNNTRSKFTIAQNQTLFFHQFHQPKGQWLKGNHLWGTLSNDDGSENVAKKMNLRSFKLNHVYLDPLNMSNASDFSWSWILKDFIQFEKEEGKFVVVCPRPP